MRPDGVGAFAARALLWLPLCFAAWYFCAGYHAALPSWLAKTFIQSWRPGLVSAVEHPARDLVFVTGLEVPQKEGPAGVITVDVNPLLYTYGLAFLAALMLASRARLWKLAAAAIALVAFQAWGIAFDFLAQVATRLGPEIATQAGLAGGEREAIALAYQLGSLIFPTLVPVALWAALERPFIARVLGAAAPDLA